MQAILIEETLWCGRFDFVIEVTANSWTKTLRHYGEQPGATLLRLEQVMYGTGSSGACHLGIKGVIVMTCLYEDERWQVNYEMGRGRPRCQKGKNTTWLDSVDEQPFLYGSQSARQGHYDCKINQTRRGVWRPPLDQAFWPSRTYANVCLCAQVKSQTRVFRVVLGDYYDSVIQYPIDAPGRVTMQRQSVELANTKHDLPGTQNGIFNE